MGINTYFYHFIEPISEDLSSLASELEKCIFITPRTVLTHSRNLIENLLQRVIKTEGIKSDLYSGLNDQIYLLDRDGYLTPEIRKSLHYIRKLGNEAAHNPRKIRYSEALLCWEHLYAIVKWYIEVYGTMDIEIPEYQDPKPENNQELDVQEILAKLGYLEKKMDGMVEEPPKKEAEIEPPNIRVEPTLDQPGFTPIRTISYKDKQVEIPFFLRDAFLLPQRFAKSENFLIKLGAVQQARIISELPNNLEGLSKHVKRFNDSHEKIFFDELKQFIEEEKKRKKLGMERQGEIFVFFNTDYIVLTEELKRVALTEENFLGVPNLLKQLNDDQIDKVELLPKELVILAKYERVGIGTVEKLFKQLKEMQLRLAKLCMDF